ncbi:MAG: hypothetical protein E7391_05185 [Ruminococcaceae bacterium]|nr:hypothetical protein [Oscillospiraceae bacterium]
MIKKTLSIILAILMIMSSFPILAIAKDANNDKIQNAFSNYFVTEKEFKKITQYVGSNSYNNLHSITTELPFTLKLYYKEPNMEKSKRDIPVIFYIINHGMERVGTEDDISIIKDFIEEGYLVFTLDYHNNKAAISPEIDWSILGARNQIMASIYEYFPKVSYTLSSAVNYSYVVPAGCRIKRDIWYYNLLENGAIGTKEKIIEAWNSNGFKAKESKIPENISKGTYKGQWYEAETIDDCVKPDGKPLDFDLRMDIVYPSKPKSKPPVYALASSSETRTGSTTHLSRPHYIGFLMRGYAAALYDHEYIPLARNDHYGYFSPFSLASLNGVKTHTAAIRCIRQYADDFGYNKDKIGVWGHSKSSYSALLGRENPELLSEITSSEGTYGPQPNLTYEGTNTPIPSNVQCLYTSMGNGTSLHKKLVNDTTVPSIIATGKEDEFGAWGYYDAMVQTYVENDVVTLQMPMLDLGHEYPYEIDTVYKYDRYVATLDFFDYHLKGKAAKLVYTYPTNNTTDYNTNSPVVLKFNAAVDEKEFLSKVKITDENGKIVKGEWTYKLGNTEFSFTTEEFKNGVTYKITVPSSLKTKEGINFEAAEHTFKVKSGDVFFAKSTNEKNTTVSYGKSNGYFEFDIKDITKDNEKDVAILNINVENDAAQVVEVYADLNGKEVKIGEKEVSGAGNVEVDISDFIKGYKEDTVKLIAKAKVAPGKTGLVLDFENVEDIASKRSTEKDPSPVSDKYMIRFGGAPTGVEIQKEGDNSFLVLKRKNSYDRIKFYNTFGAKTLTKDDIGKTYRISFDAKGVEDVTFSAGLMASYNADSAFTYDTNMYRTTISKSAKANEWTTVTFDYVIDETNVKDNILCLTIQTSDSAKDICIDNIKVEESATDIVITHTSGSNLKEGKTKPKLVISTDDTLKEITKGNYKIKVSNEKGKITVIKDELQKGNVIVIALDKDGKIVKATAAESVTSIAIPDGEYSIKIVTFDGEIKDAITIKPIDLM